jgi:hypothetical protein
LTPPPGLDATPPYLDQDDIDVLLMPSQAGLLASPIPMESTEDWERACTELIRKDARDQGAHFASIVSSRRTRPADTSDSTSTSGPTNTVDPVQARVLEKRLLEWCHFGMVQALQDVARQLGRALSDSVPEMRVVRSRMRVDKAASLIPPGQWGGDAQTRRATAWTVHACFYRPGQGRARCALVSLRLDASAPDPLAWRHQVLAIRDTGLLPEWWALK